jgi:hypothetical protein
VYGIGGLIGNEGNREGKIKAKCKIKETKVNALIT